MYLNLIARMLVCLGLAIFASSFASAEDVFFDNFTNPDPTNPDRDPVTWSPRDTSELSLDDGLVIRRNGFASAVVNGLDLGDTSIRTTLRIRSGDSIGVIARFNEARTPGGYFGYVSADGEVGIGVAGGAGDILSVTPSELRPVEEDITMQLDVIGNKIGLWAWPADETIPTNPVRVTADATIDSLAMGDITAWVSFNDFRDQPASEGVFRFVHVADAHIPIPEPSTAVLACCGFVGLLARRRSDSLAFRR